MTLSYEKAAHKMLMKLTPGLQGQQSIINSVNILICSCKKTFNITLFLRNGGSILL